MNVYLDSGLIPSFGGSGGVDHHALMGRPILPTFPPLSEIKKVERSLKTTSKKNEKNGAKMGDKLTGVGRNGKSAERDHDRGLHPQQTDGARDVQLSIPGVHRRTSSMDHSVTRAPERLTANKAIAQIPRRLPRPPAAPASSAPEPGQLLAHDPAQRPSLDPHPLSNPSIHLSPPPETARHARSSSWSDPITSQHPGIPLRRAVKNSGDPVELLGSLCDLIPPSRLDPLSPLSSSSTLHPPVLLAGLAFILEALVAERDLLSSPPVDVATTTLPLLRDRTSLQTKTGELDWNAVRSYLASFGKMLEGLMKLVMAGEACEESLQLVELVKTYIDKTRKVFGEVAGIYMEKYSCMAGWWNEEGMRGSAKEVGHWGDMIEVTATGR